MRFMLAAALAAFGWAASAQAQAPAAFDVCVRAGVLIAEPGAAPARDQTVRVKAGRIVDIAPGAQTEGCAAVIDQSARTVLPGLIDGHVHITNERHPESRLEAVVMSNESRVIEAAMFAQRTLAAGFTTIVDLGADADVIFALRDGIAAGKIGGPRILASGDAVSAHGGHGDNHGYREDVLATFPRWYVCSGADDCARATREAIRRGADIVKVTATGGVLSQTAAGLAQQLTDAELKAIVDTARTMGREVTAHAHGVDGINAALRAGVASIQHGTYLDKESIKLFKAQGAYLVPTVMAGEFVAKAAEDPNSGFVPAQRDKAREVGPKMLDMLARAKAGGVTVAFGTDSGVSRHGDNARELELMVQAGFTPAEALRAATVGGAAALGKSGEFGAIKPGLSADLIAVDGDPLADISVMRDVDFVMARGRIAKP